MPASIMVASWRVKRTRSVSLTVQTFFLLTGGGGFLLEREHHEPAAHQTSDSVVLVDGVLDTVYDIAGGIASLIGEGHHMVILVITFHYSSYDANSVACSFECSMIEAADLSRPTRFALALAGL